MEIEKEELGVEKQTQTKKTGNPLIDNGTSADQFTWVCEWLTQQKYLTTLDHLLDEAGSVPSSEGSDTNVENNEDAQMRALAGTGTVATKSSQTIKDIHSGANVLSIKFLPENAHKEKLIITSGADKCIRISNVETGELIGSISDSNIWTGPAICLDFNPLMPNRLITSCMDGSHAVVDLKIGANKNEAATFKLLKKFKDHRKHVVRVKWSPDGKLFATASYDGNVCIYGDNNNDNVYVKKKELNFPRAVETAIFTPDSQTLIVAVREDNYLHYFNVETWKEQLVNMNSFNDDHVSFTAMDLNLSSDGKYLLTSTDKNRLIMFRTGTAIQTRNFWGAPNDQWSTPRASFNLSNSYIYTTSQDKDVYIFDVTNEKKVNQLVGHTNHVRDLNRHPTREAIGTCSYDKTVILWE